MKAKILRDCLGLITETIREVFSTAYPRIRLSTYHAYTTEHFEVCYTKLVSSCHVWCPRIDASGYQCFPLRIRVSAFILRFVNYTFSRDRVKKKALVYWLIPPHNIPWGGVVHCVSAYPRIHFTIYLEVYLGRGSIFDCVSEYPRIHFTIYLEVYLGRSGIFDCVSAYPRIHLTIYPEVYLGRSGIFDCVSAYPRIHFTTYYLEVYLGRGGTFDCVSAYPAFSEVQLQNGRVFCS